MNGFRCCSANLKLAERLVHRRQALLGRLILQRMIHSKAFVIPVVRVGRGVRLQATVQAAIGGADIELAGGHSGLYRLHVMAVCVIADVGRIVAGHVRIVDRGAGRRGDRGDAVQAVIETVQCGVQWIRSVRGQTVQITGRRVRLVG